jgi:hypothetical protein
VHTCDTTLHILGTAWAFSIPSSRKCVQHFTLSFNAATITPPSHSTTAQLKQGVHIKHTFTYHLMISGEAYDKIARMLDLDMRPSGGAALEALAKGGDPNAFKWVPVRIMIMHQGPHLARLYRPASHVSLLPS